LRELGESIVSRRRRLGIDQAELAERVGKSASYLSRIEAGLVSPALDVVADLADALGADRAEYQRLALAAQLVRLAGSHLALDELRAALRYLASPESPLDPERLGD
jgi:transcriptional regulator with XRE-family HTH domain